MIKTVVQTNLVTKPLNTLDTTVVQPTSKSSEILEQNPSQELDLNLNLDTLELSRAELRSSPAESQPAKLEELEDYDRSHIEILARE